MALRYKRFYYDIDEPVNNAPIFVDAATGKRLEEIIEEQERFEAQVNAIRRMYNFRVKGEV